MKWDNLYIKYPMPFTPIAYHKGKVPRIRKAKRSEVPSMYRKDKWQEFRNIFSNYKKFKI